MARGTKRNRKTKLVNFHAQSDLLDVMDKSVEALDLDRSKFIRAAIREKAAKHGIFLPAA